MDLPKVAEKFPKQVELEAGKKYAWCACGLSHNQPFCDGKHKGTEFTPLVFECKQSKTAHFCQCKQTRTGPYCDGTHSQLDQQT